MSTRLTEEQRKVVETWGRGIAVMAGAGAGKTTTLVLKCQELLRRNPEARFAAVSFTERSASDLRAKLARDIPSLRGHWVATIHGLCGLVIREFPREAGFDGEETMLSEPESRALWTRASHGIWFDGLTDPVRDALSTLLARESQDSVLELLRRVRELAAFGALDYLKSSQDRDSQALAILAESVIERYDALKRRSGGLDFNDLEKGADRALDVAAVRETFRGRFDLVLVDEFQDTNPVQARIIRKFCREDGSNLCVVGDPKQSIYRFRDADVSLFEEFCAALPEKGELTANFRSRPGILDFTNAVCAGAFDYSSLTYEPLVPKREADPDADPVVRLEIRDPAELGRWIRAETERGVALSDMALLLRKIRGNEKWLKALSAAGIPLAVGSGGLFWEDPRVREMVAFLKWWANPVNSLSGAVFLRAPWVGVPDLEIDRWIESDPTLLESFLESRHPLAARLKALRGRVLRPAELLTELLYDEKAELELGAPILGLWHKVEELSSRGLDFHAVVTEISNASHEKRRERDVPPPRNRGQLSVLTLHSSKGLEFPHVILVDFGKPGRAPDSPLLFWDRAKGAFLGARDEAGDRDKEAEADWRANEKDKALAESKRLFYVALTRAKERLVLVCPELPEPGANAKKKAPESPFAKDDWRGWIDSAPEGSARAIQAPAPARRASREESHETHLPNLSRISFRLKRPRHSVTEWNLLSRCPRAYEWTYVRPKLTKPAAGSESPSKIERDGFSTRELGTAVHACLEKGDHGGLRELEARAGEKRFSAEPLIRWAESSAWMNGADEVWAELAFDVRVGGETLVGSMDRVVRRGKAYTIVDFKVSDSRAEKSPEVLAGKLIDAYGTQMELYAAALRALLVGEADARINAVLISISPAGVREVSVPLTGAKEIERLAARASAIVDSGNQAVPSPGALCRFCDFRASCPEGSAGASSP